MKAVATNKASSPQGWLGRARALPLRQWIKIVVYSLLVINFVQYVINDVVRMTHTVSDSWTWFDWSSAFATTFDVTAWLTLLLLLELETFLLSDDAFTRTRVAFMHGVRLLCVVAIGHTVVAFSDYLIKLNDRVEYSDTSLCAFVGSEASFTRNLAYWELDDENCRELSDASTFFLFDKNQLLSDSAGMVDEWGLAWADLIEVVTWLLILGLIELMVRLQDRGITKGRIMVFAKTLNWSLYGVLWAVSAYWAYLGHWVFAWDQALWILGFMAIGMNLSEWRDEIDAEQVSAA